MQYSRLVCRLTIHRLDQISEDYKESTNENSIAMSSYKKMIDVKGGFSHNRFPACPDKSIYVVFNVDSL